MAALWELFVHAADAFVSTAHPVARAVTPVPTAVIEGAVRLSGATGLPPETLRFLLAVFAAYPLALCVSALSSPRARVAFELLVGIPLAMFAVGEGWAYLAMTAVAGYAVLLAAPLLRGKALPVAMLVVTFGLLLARQCYKLHCCYLQWGVDFGGALMLMVVKLTSLGWSMHDGRPDEHARLQREAGDSPSARLPREGLSRAVTSRPPLLHYLAWLFSPFTLLAGPAVEYRAFQLALHPPPQATAHRQEQLRTAAQAAAGGVACLALAGFLQSRATLEPLLPAALRLPGVKLPPWAVLLESSPLLLRFAYLHLGAFMFRVRYYSAWLLAEGSAVLAGYGFEPVPEGGTRRMETVKAEGGEAGSWRGAASAFPLGFETTGQPSVAIRLWNVPVQRWLAYTAAARVPKRWSKLAAFGQSALFHGVYPGYAIGFLSLPLALAAEAEASRKVGARVEALLSSPGVAGTPHGRVLRALWRAFTTLLSLSVFAYFMLPFMVLSWERSLAGQRSFYFGGHAVALALLLLLPLLPAPTGRQAPPLQPHLRAHSAMALGAAGDPATADAVDKPLSPPGPHTHGVTAHAKAE